VKNVFLGNIFYVFNN